jgi:tetratricopeptide (TPR) repeat protein
MNNTRLQQLLAFLKEDPADPFILYALALEYTPNEPQLAKEYFGKILEKSPEYLPAYYQAAHLYAALGEAEIATGIFEKGIVLAKKLGDHATLRELQSAYEMHLFENE